MATSAAVVGGGPCGLMALKNFREDGFDATLYESRDWVGGLWKYSTDDALSTGENTIFNTSKYRAAATDFPMPDDMDDFPTAPQLYRYWNDYCDHFHLWPHIKLGAKVLAVRREQDLWALDMADKDGKSQTRHFDKVAVATGPFAKPKQPKLEGIEKFSGTVIHGTKFHEPAKYAGRNVVIVGLHASASDVACSLAGKASKVFISHRSGVVFVPRFDDDGAIYDKMPPLWFAIFSVYLSAIWPAAYYWIIDTLLGRVSKKAYPNIPESWGLSPAPSIAVSSPLISTELYPHLSSGACEPVASIDRITGPTTLELTSGRTLSNIDTIIFCTGYNFSIPLLFSPKSLNPYPKLGDPPYLYRNTFPLHPDAKIRNSLAFLGQAAVTYPGFCQFELLSMAISQIWKGRFSHLPPLPEMQTWHRNFLQWRQRTLRKYSASSPPSESFYPALVPFSDHVAWLDRTAGLGIREHFGWVERWINKTSWGFWWGDREFYDLCLCGFASPAIFRVFEGGGRKVWVGAREAVFRENRRVEEQAGRRREGVKREGVKREGVKREGVKREGVKREGVKREGVEREKEIGGG
ncbi:uncharacterized protein MYCFIDRAFT_199544 [Pseudocercospora fijiensis CIRAD86]|uniref:Uncharacterized protein n=1 Tax=Pseudocercospora fijiensis (strain CIRAD86) TaxID=383855 RepID=M2YKR1_PSEFD|nr:uncharacterized protein MYCFIDRAFT_199544 [Pseudocercospora fijiensis CIRAD86]EME78310.1 hypothetical protein MYCFIDRAFT_199544 [Pseudocercospora fijiensis CIRAD86]